MSLLVVPPPDPEPWPTLGPQVCDFIEAHLVYGPGSFKGKPYSIEPEFRAWLHRAYEVYPQGHPRAGWRRFKEADLSQRKGTAKTEKGALVTIVEAHPDGPVRCDGFDAHGEPVGRGIADPYIPLLAYSKDQTEELGYRVVKVILEECDLGEDFEVGEEAIFLLDARGRRAGEIRAMSGSPSARDGARTSYQFFDETHRLYLPSHVAAHATMVENTFKRRDADAWTMRTTTAPEPGQRSVAETQLELAEMIRSGKVKNARVFVFHRQARDDAPLETREDVMAALLEASGPASSWSADLDGLVDRFFQPGVDRNYWRRVWLNQKVAGGGKAFDLGRWAELRRDGFVAPSGSLVVAGFDGARNRDATALVATHVESCFQWPLGIWERPQHAADDWEIKQSEVTAALEQFVDRFAVWRVYCDPHHWGPMIDMWAGRFGDRIFSFDTTKWTRIGYACRTYRELQDTGVLGHDGDATFATHIGNAYRRNLRLVDEDTGEPLWTLQKERPDSPLKIDAAMAGVLSAAAYSDAVKLDIKPPKPKGYIRRIR
jgi:hypothetical protein